MAFQPSSGVKRKLSNPENGDDDLDLHQDELMNPPKRHTESQRIQNTDIPFEDLEPDNESSDSQYEYTFIDDNENNEPYIPINENRIITKHNANPLKDINENDNDNDNDIDIDINQFINDDNNDNDDEDDDLIMNNKEKPKESALELNWSDEDECIEQYESDIPTNVDNDKKEQEEEKNDNNGAIAWFPTPKDEETENKDMKYNKSAYNVLYEFHTEWPCLSFDIIRDNLGASRISIPYSLYLVCGSQANPEYAMGHLKNNNRIKNRIQFLKLNDIQKTKYDDDKDDINEEKDPEYNNITDDEPILQNRDIYTQNNCVVNRIKTHRFNNNNTHLIAFMGSDCNLYIYDGTQHILSLDGLAQDIDIVRPYMKPIFQSIHCDEGYGLAWNKNNIVPHLLTGSCAGELRLYQAKQSNFVRTMQFKTLKASIEDVEWSPCNNNLFVSVGIDKCIRIWDIRNNKKEHVARIQNAHKNDINECSWNPHVDHQHLLLTGSDDHTFKIWDLRKLKSNNKFSKKLKKCGHYYLSSWHIGPITSIEWHPNDSSSAIVASEDNQTSLWDFSLEADDEDRDKNFGAKIHNNKNNTKIPPQLLFLHAGQEDIKEVHFHPQIPNLCVSTAGSGFHIFQPDNLMESFKNQFKNMSIVD